ncbi:MAG: glycoside hydrolase family 5 protein [Sphingomicrobium sp.]
MARFRWIAAVAALIVSACTPLALERPAASATAVSAMQFKRGVNVLGYDPYWTDPSKARFQWRHLAEIKRAGFDHVRLVVFAFKFMDAQNRLDTKWLERLDAAVREAQAAGLGVIVDEHDFDTCAKDVPACRVKLPAFWRQIAPRYASAPDSIAFELLNEPHKALDPVWNDMLAELLGIVRQSNPTRTVVVGPTSWNSFHNLPTLRLPEGDRNLLVTFHYYDPFRFTHQGASWTDMVGLRGVTFGSEADLAQIRKDFDEVAAWARANNRPILLGEFGAYDKSGTPIEMRAAYANAVAREAELHGFGWDYWQFDSDFIVWDMQKNGWNEPILKALIP